MRIKLAALIKDIAETPRNPDYSTFDAFLERLKKYHEPDVLDEAVTYAMALDTRNVAQVYKDFWLCNLGEALVHSIVREDFTPIEFYATSESLEARYLVMISAFSSTPRRMIAVSKFLKDKDPYLRETARSFVEWSKSKK